MEAIQDFPAVPLGTFLSCELGISAVIIKAKYQKVKNMSTCQSVERCLETLSPLIIAFFFFTMGIVMRCVFNMKKKNSVLPSCREESQQPYFMKMSELKKQRISSVKSYEESQQPCTRSSQFYNNDLQSTDSQYVPCIFTISHHVEASRKLETFSV